VAGHRVSGAATALFVAALAGSIASPAGAQSRWSVEAGLGGGGASGGGYESGLEGLGSGRLEFAISRRGATDVLIGASTNYYFGPGAVVALADACICQPPTAICGCRTSRPGVPDFHFASIDVGVRRRIGSRFSFGGSLAIGRARVRRVGDRFGEAVGVDVAVRIAGPVHFVCAGQMLSWGTGSGAVRVYPVTLGFRLN
jgi:hypothetical protein